MRKALIELSDGMKYAALNAGAQGTGRCLFMIIMSNDLNTAITPDRWLKAMNKCYAKAEELKYEVAYVRGESLTRPLTD
ncbi:hypothetical protein [Morganella morganii]|jgi:hypothetical protein|uniref:hypothetical protein n=1 Tax=Morganella morganii TaxID=582 RepID=UPI000DF8A788|nr:hypothetical protein [Morganella morganii]EKW7744510.1 hypothetical protein [Morganella morganii]MBT0305401.1 hypothetical protein [Morganella morganii subsp. morganii]MBT0338987.1 hypothetical protein [Morganella morganii subsp. morganii]MBT0358446.1 hypothetical protein [Morganella morganii subsp. morganii]MDU2632885.1 hypothetical protein [Morganella morganii]